VFINHTLLLGPIGLLHQADGFQDVLIGKGSQIRRVADDGPFNLTENKPEMLAGLVQFFSPERIFLLLQLGAVFFDRLIGVTGAEIDTVGWTIDFHDPLLTAALGTDGSVLGGTEALTLSLSTQNTFHEGLQV
jgi:hypothetical protein